MKIQTFGTSILVFVLAVFLMAACSDTNDDNTDGDTTPDGDMAPDGDGDPDGDTDEDGDSDSVPDGDTETEEESDGDTEEEVAWTTPVDTAVCGTSGHEWLNPADMGRVVDSKNLPLFSLSRDTIESLLQTTPYAGMAQAKYGTDVYLYRYETQDRGQTVEATSILAYPVLEGEQTLPEAPLVMWLHGTSGFMDDCAPSRDEGGALFAVLFASQGYITVAPDYIGMVGMGESTGMFHPYLVGEATALASWDSVRGGLNLLESLSAPTAHDGRVVAWGGSQGGHAALFSELYAPYYAPEFELTAAVSLIPPSDLVGQAEEAVRAFGPATTTLAGAMMSLSRWYGAYDDHIEEIVRNEDPYHIATLLPELMDTTCNVNESDYEIDTVADIFQDAFIQSIEADSWDGYDLWECMLLENSVPASSIARTTDTPMLFVVSEEDELVNPAVERPGFDNLCAAGYRMNYIECKGASHSAGAAWSILEQFDWVEDRLNGVAMEDVCVRGDAVCCLGTDSGPCTEDEEAAMSTLTSHPAE